MKKYFNLLLPAFLLLPVLVFSQKSDIIKAAQMTQDDADDTIEKWNVGGLVSISFAQAGYSNWAAGGQNSLGLASVVSFHANYKSGKFSWLNDIEIGYGFQKVDGPVQKTTDQLEITSSAGYKIADHTSLSLLTNFQTQFQPGYTNAGDTVLLSDFLAPAYWVLAAGLTYSPNKNFSVFVSPATVRFIFVENQALADQGAFGVDPAVYGVAHTKIQDGKKYETQIGAYLKANYSKELMKNVILATNLELFSNYQKDPQNIVVNWTVLFQLKVNKFISATINTQLIYDNTIQVPLYGNVNGVHTLIGKGPRLQIKDILGVGLAYNL